jgi:hypothetical protein
MDCVIISFAIDMYVTYFIIFHPDYEVFQSNKKFMVLIKNCGNFKMEGKWRKTYIIYTYSLER